MTVLLGIDLGERRIGVATADTTSGAIKPLLTLRRGTLQQDAAAISRICTERRADAIVVGLPLSLDGGESEQTGRTRDWAASIESIVGVPLTLRDERLTSADAEARMGRAPRGHSGGPPSTKTRNAWRARIDREAAAVILQRELDVRSQSEVPR